MAFGVLATVNGVGDFLSSAMVGLLWSTFGQTVAFGYTAVLSIPYGRHARGTGRFRGVDAASARELDSCRRAGLRFLVRDINSVTGLALLQPTHAARLTGGRVRPRPTHRPSKTS